MEGHRTSVYEIIKLGIISSIFSDHNDEGANKPQIGHSDHNDEGENKPQIGHWGKLKYLKSKQHSHEIIGEREQIWEFVP